ncbi:peroxiredoxin family protein [Paenibacillus sp. NEAU-GSW1]|uniref:peroxiredoxin family protein n=1 Tax=Paenibacillus sp. NEAU-GSW1 TaxID=2682486 RepID=UPI0012E139EE|nr:peroxiredoxin family protein [Paenibacillus sp. NEAU-GSW1]MUT68845.1 redoxin domain-containing protein [Paenibacillus sp. NEAU-GSW1]
MSVHEQLEQAKAGFITKVPESAQEAIFQHIREQQLSGIEFGLREGGKAPDFILNNSNGDRVSLHEELAKGPVILTFYRGSWCPFCNIELRGYQQVLPEIQQLGAQVIAVSPQGPDKALAQQEKEMLCFPVLSDSNGLVSEQYRLLFELPDYLRDTFINTLRLDLAAFNHSYRWALPIPATYLIDTKGIVRHAYVSPDFMARMEPLEMIARLKQLNATTVAE